MKDIDEATRLTIELAKLLVRDMQAMGAPWQKAFLRAEFGDGEQSIKGSYALENDVRLFNTLEYKPMFAAVHEIAPRLREASSNAGRKACVALLVVDSNFNYEVKYEYENSERWAISKLNGESGIPVGYVA